MAYLALALLGGFLGWVLPAETGPVRVLAGAVLLPVAAWLLGRLWTPVNR